MALDSRVLEGLPSTAPASLAGSYFIEWPGYRAFAEFAARTYSAGHVATVLLGRRRTGAKEATVRAARALAAHHDMRVLAAATRGSHAVTAANGVMKLKDRTESQFMGEMLDSFGLRLNNNRGFVTERVTRQIAIQGRTQNEGRVCVVVDLRRPDRLFDFLHLDTLNTSLRAHGCSPHFIVLLSQLNSHEMKQFQGANSSPSLRDIAARWLGRTHIWPDITIDVVPAFIAMYDKVIRRNEPAPLSHVFAPDWWSRGWRFAGMGAALKAELHRAAKLAGLAGCTTIPCGYLVAIAEGVLNGATAASTPEEVLSRAVNDSGIDHYWRLR